MQSKTFKNFLNRLLIEGKINASAIGMSIKQSSDYTTLVNGGFIEHLPSISGGGTIRVKNREALKRYFSDKFPGIVSEDDVNTAISNVKSLRNTKAGRRNSQNIILIRGNNNVTVNDVVIDLQKYTEKFGTFSVSLKSLEAEKVCFVENLDSYMLAERVIDKEFIFIHTYGGIGKSVISKLKASIVVVFPDYDYKGLDSYLLVKSVFPKTELFIPENYEELFKASSRTIKTKNGKEQLPSISVLDSTEDIVVKIRTDIFKNKRYLEQQAIF